MHEGVQRKARLLLTGGVGVENHHIKMLVQNHLFRLNSVPLPT